jgi:carbonic anhydrase/acetyltransferase-like protein (isoleucine patch superfamily)
MIERFLAHHPKVHPQAFVHSHATVIGEVEIGEGASIWPSAVLRGDDGPIVVGSFTSIQDGCLLHNTEGFSQTTVGSRVTVGHLAILHGCTIQDDCLIGMGAVILDGAVVESGAMVGAGSLVPPGKIVTAGTLWMGNPAKMVRACGDKEKAMIDHGWREYAKRVQQYLGMARSEM